MRFGPIEIVWLAGWSLYMFGVYAPHTRRFRRQQVADERTRPLDVVLDMTTFLAWQVLPLSWIFSDWLEFADYWIPIAFRWAGAVGFALALVVLRTAYRELGENWSPKIDIREGQKLVTTGIFKHVRHPIYAGIWLWAFSQPLLIQNWIAGCSMLVLFAALYAVRVPREERMLAERFGEAYERYASSTPRVLPRLGAGRGRA